LPLLLACGPVEAGSNFAENDETGAPRIDLEDVSILYPLPEGRAVDALIAADGIVPRDLVLRMPPLVPGEAPGDTYEWLRVVAVRFDPCFGAAPGDSACRAQMRLVLQPAGKTTDLATIVMADAAVHVFYELADFGAVAKKLAAMAGAHAPRPLGVNTTLKAQGLDGPYARDLRALVQDEAARGRLSRVTFMALLGQGNKWEFGGFDVANDAVTDLAIPGTSSSRESMLLNKSPRNFAKTISPDAAPEPSATLLFDSFGALSADEEALAGAYEAALRIEDPRAHSPSDVDCVMCHTIGSSRAWADLTLLPQKTSSAFAAPGFDLSRTSSVAADPGVLRAFGYFDIVPAVSQRTVNESAAVASWVSSHVLR